MHYSNEERFCSFCHDDKLLTAANIENYANRVDVIVSYKDTQLKITIYDVKQLCIFIQFKYSQMFIQQLIC